MRSQIHLFSNIIHSTKLSLFLLKFHLPETKKMICICVLLKGNSFPVIRWPYKKSSNREFFIVHVVLFCVYSRISRNLSDHLVSAFPSLGLTKKVYFTSRTSKIPKMQHFLKNKKGIVETIHPLYFKSWF